MMPRMKNKDNQDIAKPTKLRTPFVRSLFARRTAFCSPASSDCTPMATSAACITAARTAPTHRPVGGIHGSLPIMTTNRRQHMVVESITNNNTIVEQQQQCGGVMNSGIDLCDKIAGDVLVACGVTLGVAPFVTVVDKAIVQRAAGTHTILRSSLESVTNIVRGPMGYVKSPMFLMMWGVYAATYSAANSLKTIVEHYEEEDDERVTRNKHNHEKNGTNYRQYTSISSTNSYMNSTTNVTSEGSNDNGDVSINGNVNMGKTTIFVGTTLVNSVCTLLKDRSYAKMFGTVGAAPKVPLVTYGLWASRDCMVIGSSFLLPEIVSSRLEEEFHLDRQRALTMSQMACPVVTQVVAGPLQLLGLDFYNRPLADHDFARATRARVSLLGRNFFSIVGARVARIAPAYGFGGVGNTHFRTLWRDRLKERRDTNTSVPDQRMQRRVTTFRVTNDKSSNTPTNW